MKKLMILFFGFILVASFASFVFASSGCKNLYWTDNDNKECGVKQFCGAYMYYGLQTFESKTQCENVVNESVNETLVGGDRDEHDCIGSAGYQWCEGKQKCLRSWEENCTKNNYTPCENDSDCVRDGCQWNKCVNLRDVMESVVACNYPEKAGPDNCMCKNNKCMGIKKMSNGRNAEIKIMPETASEKAIERLGQLGFNVTMKEVGNGSNSKLVYEFDAEKHYRVLGFLKRSVKFSAQVNAETGDVVNVTGRKPWWRFIAISS